MASISLVSVLIRSYSPDVKKTRAWSCVSLIYLDDAVHTSYQNTTLCSGTSCILADGSATKRLGRATSRHTELAHCHVKHIIGKSSLASKSPEKANPEKGNGSRHVGHAFLESLVKRHILRVQSGRSSPCLFVGQRRISTVSVYDFTSATSFLQAFNRIHLVNRCGLVRHINSIQHWQRVTRWKVGKMERFPLCMRSRKQVLALSMWSRVVVR